MFGHKQQFTFKADFEGHESHEMFFRGKYLEVIVISI